MRRLSERPNKSSRRHESPNDVEVASEVPTNTSDSPPGRRAASWSAGVAASEQLPTTAAALRLVAREVATTIGAEWREVPGAAHDVHREQPKVLNSMLDDLWSRSGEPSSPGR
jgi:hypothetical protein